MIARMAVECMMCWSSARVRRGAVAATVLARAGARVRLIDRATFPRDKLCGDTVNPGALAMLRRLSWPTHDRASAGCRSTACVVTGQTACRSKGAIRRRCTGWPSRRRDLDWSLVQQAMAAGAAVRDGVAVREPIVDSGRRAAAGRVASAPRARRRAMPMRARRRRLPPTGGVRRWRSRSGSRGIPRGRGAGRSAPTANVSGCSTLGEMHIRAAVLHRRRRRCRGGLTQRVRLVDAASPGIRRCAIRRRCPERARRGPDACASDSWRATLSPADRCLGPLAVERRRHARPHGLLLAGDAAGFIDPMTGDGLRFAIRGGELAAGAALDARARMEGDGVRSARRARRREFAAKWRFNRALRALVGSPLAFARGPAGARLAPPIVRAVIPRAGDWRPRPARVSACACRVCLIVVPSSSASPKAACLRATSARSVRVAGRAGRRRIPLMQVAYPGVFLAMIVEGAFLRGAAAAIC